MHGACGRPVTTSLILITASEWCEKSSQQMRRSRRDMAMHANMRKTTQTHMQSVASQRLIVKARRHPRIKKGSWDYVEKLSVGRLSSPPRMWPKFRTWAVHLSISTTETRLNSMCMKIRECFPCGCIFVVCWSVAAKAGLWTLNSRIDMQYIRISACPKVTVTQGSLSLQEHFPSEACYTAKAILLPE